MLVVTYDPNMGKPVRDGAIWDEVDTCIYWANMYHLDTDAYGSEDYYVTYATENIFHAFLVMVRRGNLSSDDIIFMYNGKRIKVFPEGTMETENHHGLPMGFMGVTTGMLRELL